MRIISTMYDKNNKNKATEKLDHFEIVLGVRNMRINSRLSCKKDGQ